MLETSPDETGTRCWASVLRTCGGPLSDEHFVSYGVFLTPTVTVDGGPSAPNGPRELPLKRLVTKSLCKHHNEELSDLDQAGIDLVNALRDIQEKRTARARAAKSGRWPPYRLTVDGVRVERWLLKTVIGARYVFRKQFGDWRPSPEMVAMAFGRHQFPPRAGLSLLAKVGDVVQNTEEVRVMFGARYDESDPTATVIELRGGYRFLCTWDRPASELGSILDFHGERYDSAVDVIHRPRQWNFNEGARDLGIALSLRLERALDSREEPQCFGFAVTVPCAEAVSRAKTCGRPRLHAGTRREHVGTDRRQLGRPVAFAESTS